MESSRVYKHRQWAVRALYVLGGFVAVDFVLRVMEWHHPVWRVLMIGAAACYLFFCVRYCIAFYKARASYRARASRRRRLSYPH